MTTMTKEYALVKLLEHGELTRQEIEEITGWTHDEVTFAIQAATMHGTVTYRNGGNQHGQFFMLKNREAVAA